MMATLGKRWEDISWVRNVRKYEIQRLSLNFTGTLNKDPMACWKSLSDFPKIIKTSVAGWCISI